MSSSSLHWLDCVLLHWNGLHDTHPHCPPTPTPVRKPANLHPADPGKPHPRERGLLPAGAPAPAHSTLMALASRARLCRHLQVLRLPLKTLEKRDCTLYLLGSSPHHAKSSRYSIILVGKKNDSFYLRRKKADFLFGIISILVSVCLIGFCPTAAAGKARAPLRWVCPAN